MPTITLQDGQVVHISQESYDALANAVQEPKELTYDEIAKKLFYRGVTYTVDPWGKIHKWEAVGDKDVDPNNSVSQNQCKQLLALNMLHNVAYYLNHGWVPDWSNMQQKKYWVIRDGEMNTIEIVINISIHHAGGVYFKSEKLCKRAIKILGETKVKEAFGIFE